MAAYYNEIDKYAVQWLRNLIAAGHLPAGDVDERDIREVKADDIRGYTQCHFFAGIGGWPLALRLAGWPDHRPVWTGSCPCQPFSSAGKDTRQSDERHLWPDWFRLIAECQPPVVFGEQVDEAIAAGWLDDAFHDMESEAYSCAAAVLPSCAVNAPHERGRLWFVADSARGRKWGMSGDISETPDRSWHTLPCLACQSSEGVLAHTERSEQPRTLFNRCDIVNQWAAPPEWRQGASAFAGHRSVCDNDHCLDCGENWDWCVCVLPRLASCFVENAESIGRGEGVGEPAGQPQRHHAAVTGRAGGIKDDTIEPGSQGFGGYGEDATGRQPEPVRPVTTANPWLDVEWIECPDGKYRPVKPGIQLLDTGIPARVHKIRAGGNAITPQVGAQFILAYEEARIMLNR